MPLPARPGESCSITMRVEIENRPRRPGIIATAIGTIGGDTGREAAMTRRRAAASAVRKITRKQAILDSRGTIFGTWRVLYPAETEKPRIMCQCVHCGVRKFITVDTLWGRRGLRCRECRIRKELSRVLGA
ncbi:MAG: hypothetical protein HZA60_09795 [Deltaproteobacteria bacterium]|nr:hypothetical protein [Deltaproteobacteria bacterium]